jgi:hypothetical protein
VLGIAQGDFEIGVLQSINLNEKLIPAHPRIAIIETEIPVSRKESGANF